ncbi:MAG: hypothetical protein E4H01_11565 [Lysobacterales bacterium]|nr:MAG: hypothetical protein E4H01_11565 [Xanthomonadales bacterium]
MKDDKIHGGKGDKAKPSDFDPDQLKMGIKVEMEHTKDRKLAREIALDHLSEDPRYYTKLKKVHKEHTAMRSHMHSFEELLEMMSSVNAWLTEGAAPPPFKAADRAKAGMSALQGRSGAQAVPPPIPQKKPSTDTSTALADVKKTAAAASSERKTLGGKLIGHRVKSTGQKVAIVDKTPASHGTGHLDITRSWHGSSENPAAPWVKARAAKGESLSDASAKIRDLIGEAIKPIKAIKPVQAIKPEKMVMPVKAKLPIKAIKPV